MSQNTRTKDQQSVFDIIKNGDGYVKTPGLLPTVFVCDACGVPRIVANEYEGMVGPGFKVCTHCYKEARDQSDS